MRLIGRLDNELSARTFGDYLLAQGIDNQIEFEKDDGWGLWIRDEDKLGRAAALLLAFQKDPTGPQYQAQARTAAGLRAGQAKAQAAYQKRVRDRRHLFRPLADPRSGLLTYGLIIISVLVCLLSDFGYDTRPIRGLFITSYDTAGPGELGNTAGLSEVRHGEIWRLLTPIFIHFGPLHILFNMIWLRDLGTMIEGRQSSWHLGLLVLVFGVCANLAQYFTSGPSFGGMSGVVYGLLGYVWIRGKMDPGSGLYLHPTTVWMMLIWFVLCFTPLFGHIANSDHAMGLGLGVAWGFLSGLWARR